MKMKNVQKRILFAIRVINLQYEIHKKILKFQKSEQCVTIT